VSADARIELRGVRVRVASCDADAVIRELGGSAWGSSARIIKQGPRGMVAVGVIRGAGEAPVVVKTHRLVGMRDQIAAAIGRSRLARQARGARLLERAGIATARTILWARGSDPAGSVEILVLEFVPGVSVAHHVSRGDLTADDRARLAVALGSQIGRIAKAGLVNRDHKASNIVVRVGADGPAPVVVDTVGIRRSHPGAARVRMVFGLVVELIGIGTLPSRSDRMRVVRAAIGEDGGGRDGARRVWRAVDALVRMHGDARPKDDPLVDPSTGV